jgi:hypothetical protein
VTFCCWLSALLPLLLLLLLEVLFDVTVKFPVNTT